MVRMCDFNDHGPAGHASDLIPGVLSLGEAVHASGSQVMAAITVGYEIRGARFNGNMEAAAAAMAAGKVLGLTEDRLANALSLALIPHVPLNKGEGHQSMWKGCRSAEAVKNGVWAALMAREGMTAPPAPFEGVGGRWAMFGREEVKLPVTPGKTTVERQGFKRSPLEASGQAVSELLPEMRAWTKVEDIASIRHYMPFGGWTEIGDAPKFDPRNRETADHSIAYLLCRGLIDGELYLDSFTEAKYMDPTLRGLMGKMTITPVKEWSGNGPARTIIRKKNGEERVWDTNGGRRTSEVDGQAAFNTPMTDEEITAKFNRAAAFMKVDNAQRDRARTVWGNIRALKDIGEAMQTLAKFGQPRPL
jgi:2-methylcitrate dehydratase